MRRVVDLQHRGYFDQPVDLEGGSGGHEIDDDVGDADVRRDLGGAGHGHDFNLEPLLREESRRHARKDGCDAHSGLQVAERANATFLAGGDREVAASELEIGELIQGAAGFLDEVEARDTGIGSAVGDKLGNVLGAHEERLEFTAERRGEGAWAGGANFQAGVGEQFAGVLGQAALVG